jgi:hypothetical protein
MAGVRRETVTSVTDLPVDAAALAGHVLDRITVEIRAAQMVAAKHQATGCPSPGDCKPCAAEARRLRDEERREYEARQPAARREAAKQHAVSAARLAAIPSRRRPRLAGLAEAAPSCAACQDHEGTLVCRSCGLSRYSDVSVLDHVNLKGGKR